MNANKSLSKLTDTELALVPVVRDGLVSRYNKGIRRPKSSTKIISDLKLVGINISAPRLRKIINKIRLEGMGVNLILTATPEGYVVTNDLNVIRSYRESLQSRIKAQVDILRAIERDQATLENRAALKITDILFRDEEK